MIGAVVVSHGSLATELVRAAGIIVGKIEGIVAVDISPDMSVEAVHDAVEGAVRTVDEGDGVLLFTDMFGGTPSNLAISIMDKGKIEVIAGVNLPMLIKLADARKTEKLPEAAVSAQEAGRKYINIASQLLARNNTR